MLHSFTYRAEQLYIRCSESVVRLCWQERLDRTWRVSIKYFLIWSLHQSSSPPLFHLRINGLFDPQQLNRLQTKQSINTQQVLLISLKVAEVLCVSSAYSFTSQIIRSANNIFVLSPSFNTLGRLTSLLFLCVYLSIGLHSAFRNNKNLKHKPT